ncbi:hypothetical protein BU15DRAFT_88956 [Melanogaster broomeanus]|nr:hypothetical protein BU15DRAFT_88956 [Melanogaster broomeanus]
MQPDFRDESDDEDTHYGPFSSLHIPAGLVHNLDLEDDFDLEDDNPGDSESQECDNDISPPIQHAHTPTKVEAVLHYMNTLGLNLPLFLDLLSWGDPECITNHKVRYERSALMVSEELPSIIERWHKPPRTTRSTHKRAQGAKPALERFAFSCVGDVVEGELEGIMSKDLSTEGLTGLFVEDLLLKLSSPGFGGTPKLWSLLVRLTQTPKQKKLNKEKIPDLVILAIICQVLYSRSHHNNRFAKMITSFLRSQGTPAKSIDLLRAFGLTMSHQWSVRALRTISENEMQTVREMVHRLPFVITHDNINIPFRVFSQRIDNQSHFDSGTASTIFFQPNAPPEPPLCNRTLQEYRAQGRKTPLTVLEIYELAQVAAPGQYERDIFQVLRYLIDSPEFDFATYTNKDHEIFTPPTPLNQLPTGERYVTRQFMLGTEHLEEASYDGNINVIMAIFHQLLLDSEEQLKQTGLYRVFVWIGDQLTSARLRGLFNFRAQDRNAFDRLDWLVPMFGWFHLLMAFANSLHKQYLGTTAGRGLMHAFTVLERKGLNTVQTRGPFHQNLHDAIYHVAEAHFRACWKVVGEVDKLEDLRSQTPEQLLALAGQIVQNLASSRAVDSIDSQPEDRRDQAFRNSVLWNHDVLRYVDLYEATRSGDVGIMEATLPHLAFRFAGGRNSNYLTEVLELLQCLRHDWPPALSDFVRRRCWLVNMTGRPHNFLPLDKRQEYNIKSLKHLETQFRSLWRGVSHTDPSKERDVQRLEESYISSNVHSEEEGRTLRTKTDEVKDIVTSGAVTLGTKKTIAHWWQRRDLVRATTEMW